jgi:hypothetical protein
MMRNPQCQKCGCDLGYCPTAAKATEAWNTRVDHADIAKLRGLLWFAWNEANSIRAASGAPLTRDGMTTCAESWWSDMTDMFAEAIGKDAQTPWATAEAIAVLAARTKTEAQP